MTFGELPVSEAVGAILAHAVKTASAMFKKGRTLTASDVQCLVDSGVARVFAARLGPDDIPEDAAASQVAKAIAGKATAAQAPFTLSLIHI